MRTIFTLLLSAMISMGLYAQFELPVDFETIGEDTVWNQFANGDNLPDYFMLADNPDKSGINKSDNCLQFIVQENADVWVGAWSDAYGEMEFTTDNFILQMMVYKNVISNCAMKVENGAEQMEVKVPNTKVDEWELLTFDFTDAINGVIRTRLVFFPDFPDVRESGSVCYVDNLGFYVEPSLIKKIKGDYLSVFPNPAYSSITVRYPQMSEIVITNLTGQNVKNFTFKGTNQKVINISNLPTGIYFLNIKTANGYISSKFTKN